MPKKSKVDERIGALFAGFHPEENVSQIESISQVNNDTAHSSVPMPARQNSERIASSGPARKKLIIIIGVATVCLLTTIFVLTRFAAASTSLPPEPPTLTPPVTSPDTPSIQDFRAPSVPSGFTATATSATTVNLVWEASSDDIGVVGYTIYRDGVSLATASGPNLAFSDTTAMPDSTYSYALDAFDQAGNHSAVSAAQQITTPAQSGSLTFLLPVEDTYVNADSPTSIYGTANTLRLDASPDVHTYLRFEVTGLDGKAISRARLKIYTNSGATRGIQVVAVTDNTWGELTTNYTNAPVLGGQLAFSPAVDAATWITLDITSYITGEGNFNFGIVTDSTTAVSLASRETGANAPQLILELH